MATFPIRSTGRAPSAQAGARSPAAPTAQPPAPPASAGRLQASRPALPDRPSRSTARPAPADAPARPAAPAPRNPPLGFASLVERHALAPPPLVRQVAQVLDPIAPPPLARQTAQVLPPSGPPRGPAAVTAPAAHAPVPARPLTEDTLQTASSGLLGMHDHPSEDFRPLAGSFAVEIQAHLGHLQSSPARGLDQRVVHAAVSADGDPARLVRALAEASDSLRTDPTPRPLVSLQTLEEAQLMLAGAHDGPPHAASARPPAERASIEDMLQQLSAASVLAARASMLRAALQAGNSAARLLDQLAALARAVR